MGLSKLPDSLTILFQGKCICMIIFQVCGGHEFFLTTQLPRTLLLERAPQFPLGNCPSPAKESDTA